MVGGLNADCFATKDLVGTLWPWFSLGCLGAFHMGHLLGEKDLGR